MQVLNLHVNMHLLSGTDPTSSWNDKCEFADWLMQVGCGNGIADDRTIAFDPQMHV